MRRVNAIEITYKIMKLANKFQYIENETYKRKFIYY